MVGSSAGPAEPPPTPAATCLARSSLPGAQGSQGQRQAALEAGAGERVERLCVTQQDYTPCLSAVPALPLPEAGRCRGLCSEVGNTEGTSCRFRSGSDLPSKGEMNSSFENTTHREGERAAASVSSQPEMKTPVSPISAPITANTGIDWGESCLSKGLLRDVAVKPFPRKM